MDILKRATATVSLLSLVGGMFLVAYLATPGDPEVDPVENVDGNSSEIPNSSTASTIIPVVEILPDHDAQLDYTLWVVHAEAETAQAEAAAARRTTTVELAPAQAIELAPAQTIENTVWDQLAECESGGNWQINTGNNHFGGLQFTLQSWQGVGGTGFPHQHSREEQIARAEKLLVLQGWQAWPGCSRRLGLR